MKKLYNFLTLCSIVLSVNYANAQFQRLSGSSLASDDLNVSIEKGKSLNLNIMFKNTGSSQVAMQPLSIVDRSTEVINGDLVISINRCSSPIKPGGTCYIYLKSQRTPTLGIKSLKLKSANLNATGSNVNLTAISNLAADNIALQTKTFTILNEGESKSLVFSNTERSKLINISVKNTGNVSSIANISLTGSSNHSISINRCSSEVKTGQTCLVYISIKKPISSESSTLVVKNDSNQIQDQLILNSSLNVASEPPVLTYSPINVIYPTKTACTGSQLMSATSWQCRGSDNVTYDSSKCSPPQQNVLSVSGNLIETIPNGSKTTTCAAGATTGSIAYNCNSNFHNEGTECLSNSRSCSVQNGTGSELWTGSWGSCQVISCNSGFSIVESSCQSNNHKPNIDNLNGILMTTDEDTNLDSSVSSLVTDEDNDSLYFTLVNGPVHGSLTLNVDGAFSYHPESNYSGSVSFQVKANDGKVDSDIATVNISINPVNDAPTAEDILSSLDENSSLYLSLLSHIHDIDVGDVLSISILSQPSHGSFIDQMSGEWKYTPDEGFFGSDSVSYKVIDSSGAESQVQTISFNVIEIPKNFKFRIMNPALSTIIYRKNGDQVKMIPFSNTASSFKDVGLVLENGDILKYSFVQRKDFVNPSPSFFKDMNQQSNQGLVSLRNNPSYEMDQLWANELTNNQLMSEADFLNILNSKNESEKSQLLSYSFTYSSAMLATANIQLDISCDSIYDSSNNLIDTGYEISSSGRKCLFKDDSNTLMYASDASTNVFRTNLLFFMNKESLDPDNSQYFFNLMDGQEYSMGIGGNFINSLNGYECSTDANSINYGNEWGIMFSNGGNVGDPNFGSFPLHSCVYLYNPTLVNTPYYDDFQEQWIDNFTNVCDSETEMGYFPSYGGDFCYRVTMGSPHYTDFVKDLFYIKNSILLRYENNLSAYFNLQQFSDIFCKNISSNINKVRQSTGDIMSLDSQDLEDVLIGNSNIIELQTIETNNIDGGTYLIPGIYDNALAPDKVCKRADYSQYEKMQVLKSKSNNEFRCMTNISYQDNGQEKYGFAINNKACSGINAAVFQSVRGLSNIKDQIKSDNNPGLIQ